MHDQENPVIRPESRLKNLNRSRETEYPKTVDSTFTQKLKEKANISRC